MNAERLIHLRAIMEQVKAFQEEHEREYDYDKFYMGSWMLENPTGIEEEPQLAMEYKTSAVAYVLPRPSLEESLSCDTSACAAGWACMDPMFYEFGLRMQSVNRFGFLPEYKGETGFEAMALFFDIPFDDSYFLFSDIAYIERGTSEDNNVRPEHVVTHINFLLNGGHYE